MFWSEINHAIVTIDHFFWLNKQVYPKQCPLSNATLCNTCYLRINSFCLPLFQEACLVLVPHPLVCLANSKRQEHLVRRQAPVCLVLQHQVQHQLDLDQDLVQLRVSLDKAPVDRRYRQWCFFFLFETDRWPLVIVPLRMTWATFTRTQFQINMVAFWNRTKHNTVSKCFHGTYMYLL